MGGTEKMRTIVFVLNRSFPARSSISMRINAFAQVGGVNSLENFARSWQRAVAFHDITPNRSSFAVADGEAPYGRLPDEERVPTHQKSLLRQQLEQDSATPTTTPQEGDDTSEAIPYVADEDRPLGSPSGQQEDDIFSQASYLGSPFGSVGTYGTLTARINEASKQHAARLFQEQQVTGDQDPDKEVEPLLVKRVEREDGKFVLAVVGQSTIYQTILNSTNVLIGVGLLSLPLGIKYAGWLAGMLFLAFSALVTGYTARLLGKCLDLDTSLITFADIAYISYGSKAKVVIGVLFSFELITACVALFVLFADSLNTLLPGWGLIEWKILCAIIVAPLSFVPLRFLGYTSSLGIICCLGRT
jgi:vesicular inhibitory amino acid transporter